MDRARPFLAVLALLFCDLPAAAEDASIPLWASETLTALCKAAASGERIDADRLAELVHATPDTAAIIADEPARLRAAAMRDRLELDIMVLAPGTMNQQGRMMATMPEARGEPAKPLFFVQTGTDCLPERGRAVSYVLNGPADRLFHFAGPLLERGDIEALNPAVPPGDASPGYIVAHVDTGVAYTLPEIAARLARNPDGSLIGADLAENDGLPFDLDPQAGPLFPRRHGTSVAAILLREAPGTMLAPIRYPGRRYDLFGNIVSAVKESGATIAAMPFGGNRLQDWTEFQAAAKAAPEILFVVSAGNDGRDIDQAPVYPASLKLDNLLVVTSCDEFGQLAAESNWGAESVDVAVPAENLETLDHRGAKVKAAGASYAVPRVAALAARLGQAHPDWSASQIKAHIVSAATPLRHAEATPVRHGWIPDPTRVAVQ